MRLVTYRKGSSKPRVGAMVDDTVFDFGALAADLARERGAVRRGRGFPKTMLELIQGGPDALAVAREALGHGEAMLKRDGVNALVERGPSEEEVDEFIAGYMLLAQQPVIVH